MDEIRECTEKICIAFVHQDEMSTRRQVAEWEKKNVIVIESAIHTLVNARDKQIKDLAMMCFRLIHRLRKYDPDWIVLKETRDYLIANNLGGSIIRSRQKESAEKNREGEHDE